MGKIKGTYRRSVLNNGNPEGDGQPLMHTAAGSIEQFFDYSILLAAEVSSLSKANQPTDELSVCMSLHSDISTTVIH